MIELLLGFNLLYALMLYRNGRKNAAGFAIVFVLLSSALYFMNFFLDEYSKYLSSKYGEDAYYNLVSYIEIITSTDSLPAALYMLMTLSMVVGILSTLQVTVFVAVMQAKPFAVKTELGRSFSCARTERAIVITESFHPSTFAHLRI